MTHFSPSAGIQPAQRRVESDILRCTRCDLAYSTDQIAFGCLACSTSVPANLEFEHSHMDHDAQVLRSAWQSRPPGLWRYVEMLPVAAEQAVTLGEGGTPLLACRRVGQAIGLPNLLIKNESVNPTWSFKDRLAAVAVSWAKMTGRPGVAASSSGNAGAAVAAYAARAGLPCIIFTTRSYPGIMQRFMRSYGAMVVATPTGPDRWILNRAIADEWGWLPISNVADPPVGSHPVGIEGYKTIAYEIASDLDWQIPDIVVIPVAYGDSIAGIWKGFKEMYALGLVGALPRMIAAETYGSLQRALEHVESGPLDSGGSGSQAFSVATPRGTYQALRALRESNGLAVAISDEEARAAQRTLASEEGLFVELSAALPLAAARKLAESGELRSGDRVGLLITSSGLKDLEPPLMSHDQDLPLVEPDLDQLRATLQNCFGYVP